MSKCEKCGSTKDLILNLAFSKSTTECAACLNAALPADSPIHYATRSEAIHSEAERLMSQLNGKDSPLTDHEHKLGRALTKYFLRYRVAVAGVHSPSVAGEVKS